MTMVELDAVREAEPDGGLLGGRYRLSQRVWSGYGDSGAALWCGFDELLRRRVAVHTVPACSPVLPGLAEVVQRCARADDARLATVYDVDYAGDLAYIVSEWVADPDLEQLLLRTGPPSPAFAAAIIADAAEALAAAHRAGQSHLRVDARCLHWGNSGLKITGLGTDAVLHGFTSSGPVPSGPAQPDAEAAAADTTALAQVLYALITGFWPGDEQTALPAAPRHRTSLCEPRQLRPDVPPMLNAIVCHALRGQPGWGALTIQTPAELAAALRAGLPASRAGSRVPGPQLPPAHVQHVTACPGTRRGACGLPS